MQQITKLIFWIFPKFHSHNFLFRSHSKYGTTMANFNAKWLWCDNSRHADPMQRRRKARCQSQCFKTKNAMYFTYFYHKQWRPKRYTEVDMPRKLLKTHRITYKMPIPPPGRPAVDSFSFRWWYWAGCVYVYANCGCHIVQNKLPVIFHLASSSPFCHFAGPRIAHRNHCVFMENCLRFVYSLAFIFRGLLCTGEKWSLSLSLFLPRHSDYFDFWCGCWSRIHSIRSLSPSKKLEKCVCWCV